MEGRPIEQAVSGGDAEAARPRGDRLKPELQQHPLESRIYAVPGRAVPLTQQETG